MQQTTIEYRVEEFEADLHNVHLAAQQRLNQLAEHGWRLHGFAGYTGGGYERSRLLMTLYRERMPRTLEGNV